MISLKLLSWAGLVAFLGAYAWVTPAQAAHTRITNPNAATVEILGRGILWSVGFDRVLDDHLAAGLGIGSVKIQGSSESATVIPAYFNYYFAKEQGSLFATGGVSLVTGAGNLDGLKSDVGGIKFSSSSVLPTFGVGYENRSDAGFLFRVAAYGLIGKEIAPWGGLSVGWSF